MQRLFLMFPTGLPGLALLLLRGSVASALLADTYLYRQDLSVWLQGTALLVSFLISVGYLTPIVAALGLALHGFAWFAPGPGNLAASLIVCLDAGALALLGPGAYSIDSYRFGRRVVVLPPN